MFGWDIPVVDTLCMLSYDVGADVARVESVQLFEYQH